MGIFDFLRKSAPPAGGPVDKKVGGPARVVADKRAQTYDRMEALQTLADLRSAEGAAALLRRFTFSIDPSITDQEEKDVAFQGVVAAGKAAVPKVLDFCVKAEALTWPLKLLRELLPDDEYRAKLIELLERFDTEYARNVEPKLQVIMALEELVAPEVRDAVEPFLEDVNETVRFHAVQTVFAQGDATIVPKLIELLAREESVRVKNKVAEGLMFRGWPVPSELRERARAALRESSGYDVGGGGRIEKNAGGYR